MESAQNFPPLRSIQEDINGGVLVGNLDASTDHQIVNRWSALKGRPSKPIYRAELRERGEFEQLRSLLPESFFDPLNTLLGLVDLEPIHPEPTKESVDRWNNRHFVPDLVGSLLDMLDSPGADGLLVPHLVGAYLGLELRRTPQGVDSWERLDAIFVPGSRTFDRAAEAIRCYRRSRGNALLVTSGAHPYYDPDQSNYADVTEAEASAAYLRLLGVPTKAIEIEGGDNTSKDTAENADFVVEALGYRLPDCSSYSVLIASSPFHLARSGLNLTASFAERGIAAEIYAVGSRASRYWAESYFLNDTKQAYTRDEMMKVVLNEYTKIAHDLCTRRVPSEVKEQAKRYG